MLSPRTGLVDVLRRPALALDLRPAQWDRLIRQARAANLPGTLAQRLQQAGLAAAVPAAPRAHLLSAMRLVQQQRLAVGREIGHIQRALATVGVPFALLKGAAYLAADLPPARGRLFGDVDILVPKARLAEVESALLIHGWHSDLLDAYDQRYYRQWMHELPPMTHGLRGSAIDVHHTLLPETARVRLNTPPLFDDWQPVGGHRGVHVLPPADMLLHSAAHLFHEGEFPNALRDLVDLDGLLRHFGAMPGFWQQLVWRSQVLRLQGPLRHALVHCQRVLDTPVPADVLRASARHAPGPLARRVLDGCYAQVFTPPLPAQEPATRRTARAALYLRSHWLRMPTLLLAAHLVRKAWRKLAVAEAHPDSTPQPAAADAPPAQAEAPRTARTAAAVATPATAER